MTNIDINQHKMLIKVIKIGAIGNGFVGSSMYKSFKLKEKSDLIGYDKYKNGGIGYFEECLKLFWTVL